MLAASSDPAMYADFLIVGACFVRPLLRLKPRRNPLAPVELDSYHTTIVWSLLKHPPFIGFSQIAWVAAHNSGFLKAVIDAMLVPTRKIDAFPKLQ